MKKIIGFIFTILIAFSLCGCEGIVKRIIEGDITSIKTALVLDSENENDHGMNQMAIEALKEYADKVKMKFDIYPLSNLYATNEERTEVMEKAIKDGCNIIFIIGYQNYYAIAALAPKYKEAKFVHIDGYEVQSENTTCLSFDKTYMGYIAGYTTVKENYSNIGAVFGGYGGNIQVNALSYGFLQGVNDAAKELNKTVNLKVTYRGAGNFVTTPELCSLMDEWYSSDTEIVFSCGGDIVRGISESCEKVSGKAVFGVDTDMSYASDRVIASSAPRYTKSFEYCINLILKGKWGTLSKRQITIGIKEDALTLYPDSTDSWKLQNFSHDDFLNLCESLKTKDLTIIDGIYEYSNIYTLSTLETLGNSLSNINITTFE